MRPVADNDGLAASGMSKYRGDIAHSAAGNQQRGFFSSKFRYHFLQAVNGGVFMVDIVAKFSVVHGFAHCLRRQRNCIAA